MLGISVVGLTILSKRGHQMIELPKKAVTDLLRRHPTVYKRILEASIEPELPIVEEIKKILKTKES